MSMGYAIRTNMATVRGRSFCDMPRRIIRYSATIRDGRDDVLDSGGGTKKIVAIVAHRRGLSVKDKV